MPTYAAYNSRVQIDASFVRANSVTINVKADLLDVTHFDQSAGGETDGLGKYIQGVRDADITVDAHWFSEDNPYADAGLDIAPGNFFFIQVFLDRANLPAVAWIFSRVVCESVDHMQAVRDALHFTARFKNSGKVWSKPTT